MAPAQSRSIGFPLVCALAYAGGVIGYLPLLTLLLPMQVARIAGAQRFAVLAAILAVGAVAAGASNILFGWLSDRSRRAGGGRRRWIAMGLVATLATFAVLPAARTPAAVTVSIAAFQVALNALLAPLMALLAEEVPESQTGLTTGMFAAGPPVAALLSLTLAAPFFADEASRLALVGMVSAICLAPMLLVRAQPSCQAPRAAATPLPRRDLAIAWVARLLIQIAGTVLFADLLYLMDEPVDPGDGHVTIAHMGSLLMLANLVPVPVAILLGRWSDRLGRRKPFLLATAVIAALGPVAMVAASGGTGRTAGLLLFSVGWGAFLPLQVGYIMRLLPDPDHRGRDLGIVNLANTLPVLIGQALTWLIATPRHADILLFALAGLTLAGGLMTLGVRSRR